MVVVPFLHDVVFPSATNLDRLAPLRINAHESAFSIFLWPGVSSHWIVSLEYVVGKGSLRKWSFAASRSAACRRLIPGWW